MKDRESWATTCSPLNLKKKGDANCASGAGKRRFGLEPQSKLSDAQGWGCLVRETWASPVSGFSGLAKKTKQTCKKKKKEGHPEYVGFCLFVSFSTINHTDVLGGRREAIHPEASIDYFKHPWHQLLVALFQQLKGLFMSGRLRLRHFEDNEYTVKASIAISKLLVGSYGKSRSMPPEKYS